jgi:3,4-dihydroxy 2-butanone 4-phosphate synthase/GTP cyclohydrolase II
MQLAEWLSLNGIKRKDFAEMVGVSPAHITQLCDGKSWPGRDVAERISRETGGQVTANDFLPSAGAAC